MSSSPSFREDVCDVVPSLTTPGATITMKSSEHATARSSWATATHRAFAPSQANMAPSPLPSPHAHAQIVQYGVHSTHGFASASYVFKPREDHHDFGSSRDGFHGVPPMASPPSNARGSSLTASSAPSLSTSTSRSAIENALALRKARSGNDHL